MSDAPSTSPVYGLIARLEPWAFVIAVGGILFFSPKGLFWLLLLVFAVLRAGRLWHEKWNSYRADTASEFLAALVTVPLIVLVYFGFARVWPTLVFDDPQSQRVERFELADYYLLEPEGSAAFEAELRIARDPRIARAFRLTAERREPGGMTTGLLSGYLTERSMTASKQSGWRLPAALQQLEGNFLSGLGGAPMDQSHRAELSFDPNGRLQRLRILHEGKVVYSARILPAS